MIPYCVKQVTIVSGQSISNEINLEDYRYFAIQMPSAWDAANITFLAATESGGTFQPIYSGGGEVAETVTAGTCAAITDNALAIASLQYIKIRSGTATTPVNQTATRTLNLICKE